MSDSKKEALARAFTLPKPLPRRDVPDAEAQHFERAAELVLVPAQPKPSKRRRPSRGERMAVYLPPELAEALRVRCAHERRSMSDAVTEAVSIWACRPTGT